MTPRAVLLDCDGVLVDSEPIAFGLLAGDLARHGLPMDHAEMEARFMGGTIPGLWAGARALGADLPEGWVTDFYARLYARLALGCPAMPGAEALLDALDAAGVGYAVGSNGAPRKMEITLSQHPRLWNRLRDRAFSGQALGCPKPDPGLWRHCAAALGAAPADCVVIDDSPAGAIAAQRAGIRCLGLATGGKGSAGAARLLAEGAEIVESLDEARALLGF
ncbi:MAG TPA: HAD family phosphatase [Paracoccaceae bacterium]|nr:HAD family phosphatase [Paracoccaceae bacterium]HMO70172.1 HAD family phosphatase [Paracoccaceae bacterium]